MWLLFQYHLNKATILQYNPYSLPKATEASLYWQDDTYTIGNTLERQEKLFWVWMPHQQCSTGAEGQNGAFWEQLWIHRLLSLLPLMCLLQRSEATTALRLV